MSRRVWALAVLAALAVAGCDQGTRVAGLVGGNAASVRFVNATGSPLDLTANGQTFTAGGHVPAGTSSGCLPVTSTVNVGIRLAGEPSDVFDAAPGTGSLDVYVTAPGEPLSIPSTASLGFGGGTPFFDVNPGTSQVRFTVATTPVLAFDVGQIVLTPGARATLVLAPAAAGTSTPTVMLLPAC